MGNYSCGWHKCGKYGEYLAYIEFGNLTRLEEYYGIEKVPYIMQNGKKTCAYGLSLGSFQQNLASGKILWD